MATIAADMAASPNGSNESNTSPSQDRGNDNSGKKRSAAEATVADTPPMPKRRNFPAKADSEATANGAKKRGGKANTDDTVKKEKAENDTADADEPTTTGIRRFTPINQTETAPTEVAPVTPAKKSKAAKNAETPRKRSANKAETASPRGIPKSFEEAGEADRMLFKMREEGQDWATIRKMWKDVTGQDTATSSLPNRYNRIKCNMMRLKPGHARLLLETKARIEREFESSKWSSIATAVNSETNEAYQWAFLQKQVKDLEVNGGLAALSNEAHVSTGDGEDEAHSNVIKDEVVVDDAGNEAA